MSLNHQNGLLRTEREGFEPSLGLTLKQFSRLPHSTTLPPLQKCRLMVYILHLFTG